MVINGILLGSCVSIAASLLLVLIVFLVIGSEHPRIAPEIASLTTSMFIFLGMTAISAVSFYSVAKDQRWLWLAQAGALSGLLATGWYYWP
jgi:hypothetical protein